MIGRRLVDPLLLASKLPEGGEDDDHSLMDIMLLVYNVNVKSLVDQQTEKLAVLAGPFFLAIALEMR